MIYSIKLQSPQLGIFLYQPHEIHQLQRDHIK